MDYFDQTAEFWLEKIAVVDENNKIRDEEQYRVYSSKRQYRKEDAFEFAARASADPEVKLPVAVYYGSKIRSYRDGKAMMDIEVQTSGL